MNILILDWRDPKNPRSGGAEVITFKYAKHWARTGHSVCWICNTFPGCSRNEMLSGVKFIRVSPNLGFTVFELIFTYPLFLSAAILKAFRLIHTQKIDMVIDEIHGLPFFTPFYSRARNVLLVCEVAGPIWDKMFPFPISLIGKFLEKVIYYVYHNTETWAISQNTKKDIFDLNKNSNIKILPLGIDFKKRPNVKKFSFPSAVFLGRLVKMKGVESAIAAAADIAKKLPKFHLYIIGLAGNEYLDFLKNLAFDLKISKNVTFCGRLTEEAKYKLLAQCHFLLHPSYKEGFGLTVLEAGLMGTPTIARTGSSLDNLITHAHNGLIFTNNQNISNLFINYYSRQQYQKLQKGATKLATRYLWNKILTKL
ncbi:MAG: Glycosyl transferase group 1 [Candidatus Amesbacteria bacterium GW2011_GWA2_47_11b]|uniref:Glycosyl transferase group 1 n=2 Tax=Candidatus Amesiibacteriota TaxID=1752730 RepID=A0A0G1SLL0_9BACT|nr:MAG: Glycosyl transferase group 1 [Candidatus Curtissbacteria bacterium GW2011_GWB1_40_28]KKU29396.1 MAG: Glycosyl transferase group 1 [Microgenomates group bacterium GW2011_GWC1_46_20]KKU58498.1 MAG: Glycosyl transferase group 1 [Candidatus Amesbacteria bacterium GW2011_GWA2_47_11b]KKU70337.1 MAG: Glycosyl transferase group 1 [Candidatus Amesbacteria bacterium GW2011_GWA1_47_20]HCH59276.1 hypothetical protein [Candidatus Zambryskibacteria bacterium]